MAKQRNKTGRFVETATLDDVLAAFDDVEGPPVVTSADIADATGLSADSARRKLNTLRDRGQVAKRDTAGRVALYWRTDDVESDGTFDTEDIHAQDTPAGQGVTGDTHPEATRTETDATHAEGTARDRSEGKRSGSEPPASWGAQTREKTREEVGGKMDGEYTLNAAEGILRDLDLPGRGSKLDARIDTLLTMYCVLYERANQSLSKDALLALVDPDDVGYSSETSFWNNCVKANSSQGRDTNALVALPGVEDRGGGDYRLVDESRTADAEPASGDDSQSPTEGVDVYDPTEEF